MRRRKRLPRPRGESMHIAEQQPAGRIRYDGSAGICLRVLRVDTVRRRETVRRCRPSGREAGSQCPKAGFGHKKTKPGEAE